MKKINIPAILFFIFASNILYSQDVMLPPPLDVPIMNAMSGNWVSEPYQFMGTTMTDEVSQKMVFNGQFMQVDVKSTGTNGFVYEGMIMIAPSKDGTISGWSFDVFGSGGLTTYTGTWKDNMVYVYGTSGWGTESRVINVDGSVMTQNVIYKMKDNTGKEMPEQSITISLNKK